MPVTFRILPKRGLVVVQFVGSASIDDLTTASKSYVLDPHYASGQKQLVDLTHITSFERDYVRFMELQAAKAERLAGEGVQSLAVYVAPTPISREVASLFTRTWSETSAVVTMTQHSEAQAMALLGQPEDSIDAMFATEDGQTLQ